MKKDSIRDAFEIEIRRRQHKSMPIHGLEIARVSRKVGLPTRDALFEMRRNERISAETGVDAHDSLALFVNELCKLKNPVRIAEFLCTPAPLTIDFLESGLSKNLDLVVPNRDLAESLSVLFDGTPVSILYSIEDLDPNTRFELIVCQPPFGQHSRTDESDGFGGEVIRRFAPFVATGGSLFWVTGRGVTQAKRSQKTLSALELDGLHIAAILDLASGALPGSMIEGSAIVLTRRKVAERFVGAIRNPDVAKTTAVAYTLGPTKKSGMTWTWRDSDYFGSFAAIERERLLGKLVPRGSHELITLKDLLVSEHVRRVNQAVIDYEPEASFLFVPSFPRSRVTADLEDQTVTSREVYRFPVNPAKANARFLVVLLNSSYGRELRASVALGVAIERNSLNSLLDLKLAIPEIETQDRIARIHGDIHLMQSAVQEIENTLERDWTGLQEASEKIDGLKAVLDIESKISEWWRELPYPIASIYRRFQVSTDSKVRLDALLHFFEMVAIYLAVVGLSHVKAMRPDWREVISNWLHPADSAGINRADFGMWIKLAGVSLKDVSRIVSDKKLSEIATETAGPELVQVARQIGTLRKATEALDVARRIRNSTKGHGGYLKSKDVERRNIELQQLIRDMYEITALVFRRLQLVLPGKAEVTDNFMRYEVQKLAGSDPIFETETVDLVRGVKSNTLAFWMSGTQVMCRAMPFFRLGAPQHLQETSFYVFNRIEDCGYRWISYQEAREQEFIAPDDDLSEIIDLPKNTE